MNDRKRTDKFQSETPKGLKVDNTDAKGQPIDFDEDGDDEDDRSESDTSN